MPNLYVALKQILPDPILQYGTVLTSDGAGCTIELPGGARVTARGAAAPGDKVFFRNGVIEGPAPNMGVEFVEV